MIAIKNLAYSYKRSDFTLNVNELTANDGEIIAVLGPNGAGKSTFIKCVTGILKPDRGEIIADDRNVNDMRPSEKARTFAYVPQSVRMDDMSVFEAVLLGRKPYVKLNATDKDLEITERVLKELSLTDYALKNVGELSGGERQKVAIAAALAQETKSIFFDEPTANLDIAGQIEVMERVREIARTRGIAVVINVHDLNLAYRYSDSYALMNKGTLVTTGATKDIDIDALSSVFATDIKLIEADGRKIIIYGKDNGKV